MTLGKFISLRVETSISNSIIAINLCIIESIESFFFSFFFFLSLCIGKGLHQITQASLKCHPSRWAHKCTFFKRNGPPPLYSCSLKIPLKVLTHRQSLRLRNAMDISIEMEREWEDVWPGLNLINNKRKGIGY